MKYLKKSVACPKNYCYCLKILYSFHVKILSCLLSHLFFHMYVLTLKISMWAHQSCHLHKFNCVCILVTQSYLTLCDPMDPTWPHGSLPGSSVHGILQARILECIALPFYSGSSKPGDWAQISCIGGRFFTIWATRKTLSLIIWANFYFFFLKIH